VQAWAQQNNVTTHYFDTADVRAKAEIERFNRTVRELLNIWQLSEGPNWGDEALEQLCTYYNNRRHTSLGMSPSQAYADAAARGRLRTSAYDRGVAYREMLNALVPGTRVRVWVGVDPERTPKENRLFLFNRKAGPRWTARVYTIERFDGYKLTLEGKRRRVSPRDVLVVGPAGDVEPSEDAETVAERARRRQVQQLHRAGLTEVARDLDNESMPEGGPTADQSVKRTARSTRGLRPARFED
jgi:hypothetical protein